MNGVFYYEILILIKTKNINVCCFQLITNQTNHNYLFQRHQHYNKKGLNMFLVPIKFGTSKFSPYLILIGFLVPIKIIYM